jgi:hypothetical protein
MHLLTKSILTSALVILFIGLSSIHFYWAFGGKFGIDSALPMNAEGTKILNPTSLDSLIVGGGLLIFAFLYLFSIYTPQNKFILIIRNIGFWGIPLVFILRAIGDFKYIGFFKQITTTQFAYLDTVFYSPLCLLIAIFGFIVVRKNNNSSYEKRA